MNPMQMIINQMINSPAAKSNPILRNAVEKYQTGDINGLKEIAQNTMKEKNIDINQITEQVQKMFSNNR